jgi:hypothetical protein
MLRFAHKTENRAAVPGPEYTPPLVVTLVRGRSHRLYQQLAEWEPPPGADDHKFLRHTVVCPSVRPDLLIRNLSDSVVIHDPGSLESHSLNRTAAEIIRLADGTRNLASIAREYTTRFGVDADTAWNDVLVTLEDFLDRKLLVTRSR